MSVRVKKGLKVMLNFFLVMKDVMTLLSHAQVPTLLLLMQAEMTKPVFRWECISL
jgi:hypothetical protein